MNGGMLELGLRNNGGLPGPLHVRTLYRKEAANEAAKEAAAATMQEGGVEQEEGVIIIMSTMYY
eukprot:COSAG05_NODE_266_length_12619_cov_81.601677_1_plen_64_part_00